MSANGHTAAINTQLPWCGQSPKLTPRAPQDSPQGPQGKRLSDRTSICRCPHEQVPRKVLVPWSKTTMNRWIVCLRPASSQHICLLPEATWTTWQEGCSCFALACMLVAKFSHWNHLPLKGSRIYHSKTYHFGIRVFCELKAVEKKTDKRKALCPHPVCLKAGQKFVNASPLPSTRTEVNHWRPP